MESCSKYLSKKVDSKGVPLKPFDIVKWAQEQGTRPLTTRLLLGIANELKTMISNIDDRPVYVDANALLYDQFLAEKIYNATFVESDHQKAYFFKLGLQTMVGMAVNAISWDYSPLL